MFVYEAQVNLINKTKDFDLLNLVNTWTGHRERRQRPKLTPKVMTASFSEESAVK